MKDMIKKNTDEKPDEEILRVRSGKVPSTGASVSVDSGTLPSQRLPEHHTVDFYGGFTRYA